MHYGTSMRWIPSPQSSTRGPLVRSPLIAGTTTPLVSEGSAALVLDPMIDGFHLTRVLMDGGSSLNLLYQDTVRKMGIRSLEDQTHQNHLLGRHPRCRGPLYGLNHTGSGLRITGQLPKRGVNLRYRPVPQWLSCTARASRICKIQCGTALRIPQAQDART